MRHYHIQLKDRATGKAVTASGGKCYVATNDEEAKATLYDSTGAAATNPASLTNGVIDFYVADSVVLVDLYIQAPSGHFVVVKDVAASGPNDIFIDKSQTHTVMVIPFSSADIADATETDTGFDLPTNAAVLPVGLGADVTNAASTETISFGLLSTESGGDADGFAALLSIGTAASVTAKNTITAGGTEDYLSSTTLGALLNDFTAGANSAGDVGTSNPKAHICDGTAKSISITTTAGTAAAVGEGFLKIPVQLPVASIG